MVSLVDSNKCYIDLRASFHMVENKKSFNHLKEKGMQFQIELGDDGQYVAKGVDTISF